MKNRKDPKDSSNQRADEKKIKDQDAVLSDADLEKTSGAGGFDTADNGSSQEGTCSGWWCQGT